MNVNIEELAAAQHEIWSHWMRYMFSQCGRNETGTMYIPSDKVDRWMRQVGMAYSELSEQEKESDRNIVKDFVLPRLFRG